MASGTPTLATKLPGMPEECYNYVYLFEDATIDGITEALSEILSKDRKELHEQGLRAKRFILEKKNNVVQAGKIYELFLGASCL